MDGKGARTQESEVAYPKLHAWLVEELRLDSRNPDGLVWWLFYKAWITAHLGDVTGPVPDDSKKPNFTIKQVV